MTTSAHSHGGGAGRNRRLTEIAGGLRAKGLGRDEIETELLAHPERDGLPESECRNIARSAMRWPAGDARQREAGRSLATYRRPPKSKSDLEKDRAAWASHANARQTPVKDWFVRRIALPKGMDVRAAMESLAVECGFSKSHKDGDTGTYRPAIVFPFLTVSGEPTGAIKLRYIEHPDLWPRYRSFETVSDADGSERQIEEILPALKSRSKGPMSLIGGNRLLAYDRDRPLHVVAGEVDWMNAVLNGMQAVGLPGEGMKSLALEEAEELRKFSRVVLLLDSDKAGIEAANAVSREWRVHGIAAKWTPPNPGWAKKGKDLSEWLKSGIPVAEIEAWAEEAAIEPEPEPEPVPKPDRGAAEADVGEKRERRPDKRAVVLLNSPDNKTGAEIADEVLAALARRDEGLFVRGNRLAMVVRGGRPRGPVERPEDAPAIVGVENANLRERIGRHVVFKAKVWNPEKRKWTDEPRSLPHGLDGQIQARKEWPGLRPLRGVSEFPIMRGDGSLALDPGYDPSSGWYLTRGAEVAIPSAPSRADAVAAAKRLLEPVSEFPWAEPWHESAWLAALLTPMVWDLVRGVAPIFMFEASAQGSGKTLLAKTAAAILLGRPPATMPMSKDEAETSKTLLSACLAGDTILLIDNVKGTLDSSSLEGLVTSGVIAGRLLGTNDIARFAVPFTIYATANNPSLSPDMTRRLLPIRLTPGVENPEGRGGFRIRDLEAHAIAHRTGLLADAATILAAYTRAESPEFDLTPWGSFERWTRIVRNALVWIELPDPAMGVRAMAEAADSETESLRRLLGVLASFDSGNGFTTRDLAAAYAEPDGQVWKNPDLREAIEAIGVAKAGEVNLRSLGKHLSANREKVVGGVMLDSAGEGKFGRVWTIRKTG